MKKRGTTFFSTAGMICSPSKANGRLLFRDSCLQHLQAQVQTSPGIISLFGVKRHEFQRQNGPRCNLCFLHELTNSEARPTGPPATLPMSSGKSFDRSHCLGQRPKRLL